MGDGGNESVAVTAGIWGFLVLFGLAIACWLLFRSMNKHLRTAQWNDQKAREEQGLPPERPQLPRSASPVKPEVAPKQADGQQTDPPPPAH